MCIRLLKINLVHPSVSSSVLLHSRKFLEALLDSAKVKYLNSSAPFCFSLLNHVLFFRACDPYSSLIFRYYPLLLRFSFLFTIHIKEFVPFRLPLVYLFQLYCSILLALILPLFATGYLAPTVLPFTLHQLTWPTSIHSVQHLSRVNYILFCFPFFICGR